MRLREIVYGATDAEKELIARLCEQEDIPCLIAYKLVKGGLKIEGTQKVFQQGRERKQDTNSNSDIS